MCPISATYVIWVLLIKFKVKCVKFNVPFRNSQSTETKIMIRCGAGSAYTTGEPEITPSFWWGSSCLVFSLLCCVSSLLLFVYVLFHLGIVCLFVDFSFLAIALSGYFRSMNLIVPLVSSPQFCIIISHTVVR